MEFYWKEYFNNCTWPIWLRWIFFIPAGILSTSIIQGALRLFNSETPFIAECLARFVEIWAFFIVSLWVLPKFNKIFLWLISILYIIFYIGFIVVVFLKKIQSNQLWYDIILALIAVCSTFASIYYFSHREYNEKGIECICYDEGEI